MELVVLRPERSEGACSGASRCRACARARLGAIRWHWPFLRLLMPGHKPKVLLAMSGGVGSSVAAALLKRDGYDVVGCFMRLGSPGESLDELLPADAACEVATSTNPGKIGHQGGC